MTHEEDAAVCAYTVKRVAGKVPVIAGSGSNCTATMLEKSLMYEKLGVDGLLLISPYYNKANAEGMYRHFATIADAVHIPCILYNVPGRTSCSIPVEVVERLSRHPNIAAIKEASGDIAYAVKVARFLGDDFAMYCGNDDITIPCSRSAPAASFPFRRMLSRRRRITWSWIIWAGTASGALAAQLRYLPLINGLFMEDNPIPVKTAANLMGLRGGSFRLPLYDMTPAHQAELKRLMEEAGIL
jgi:4-hydroxy-tetrahydrodipicolinate synthase